MYDYTVRTKKNAIDHYVAEFMTSPRIRDEHERNVILKASGARGPLREIGRMLTKNTRR